MDTTQLLVLAFAATASAVIKNGAVIGAGIFLLPVLTLVFPAKTALGLGAPIMLVADLAGLRNYWCEWEDWRELARLGLSVVLGVLAGASLIPVIPASAFKLGIGLFATGFGAYRLFCESPLGRRPDRDGGRPEPARTGLGWTLGLGFAGGVATALAHAGGVLWSLLFLGKGLDKRCFVGSLILLVTLSDTVKVAAYMRMGILSQDSLLVVLALSPLILLCSNLGNALNKRVDPLLFRRVVLVLILAVGLRLLLA